MDYNYFIGIDVSKDSFAVSLQAKDDARRAEAERAGLPQKPVEFKNTEEGITAFLAAFAPALPTALTVLEATGKYEHMLLVALLRSGAAAHRASGYQTACFIRSLRPHCKTDRSDARALACYAKERKDSLALAVIPTETDERLQALMSRRRDVLEMKVAEQQRAQHPRYAACRDRVQKSLEWLCEELEEIDEEILRAVAQCPEKTQAVALMKTVPGIGDKTALTLLISMPELGTLDRRRAAALAGVAPCPNDSGKYQGYRATRGGRKDVKSALFRAALAASRGKSPLADFYKKLIQNGKKPMVALIALARKIIVIINAKLRENILTQS